MFNLLLLALAALRVVVSARTHSEWMHYALSLAERGRLSTAPNPWVGCVIVARDGQTVLAEGFHTQKGAPHAEAAALMDARERGVSEQQFAEATAYVTLEPCHRGPGKTTPPCDEALVASGLREVHVALVDPDPSFGKAGVEYMRASGVRVTVGTGAAALCSSAHGQLLECARPMCSTDGSFGSCKRVARELQDGVAGQRTRPGRQRAVSFGSAAPPLAAQAPRQLRLRCARTCINASRSGLTLSSRLKAPSASPPPRLRLAETALVCTAALASPPHAIPCPSCRSRARQTGGSLVKMERRNGSPVLLLHSNQASAL